MLKCRLRGDRPVLNVVPFGAVLGPLFYVLVALAALTSTISLLEVVVSYFIDERDMPRRKATLVIGGAIFVLTVLSALSFGALPGLSNFEIFEGKMGSSPRSTTSLRTGRCRSAGC